MLLLLITSPPSCREGCVLEEGATQHEDIEIQQKGQMGEKELPNVTHEQETGNSSSQEEPMCVSVSPHGTRSATLQHLHESDFQKR